MAAATSAARIAEERVIETAELPFEFCLNALRLVDGFDSETFEERTALPRSVIESACGEALERGLLEQAGQRWTPTPLGRRFLNDLQALFLTDGHADARAANRENHSGVATPPRTVVAGGPEIGYGAETVIHTRPR
jgi:hypothetical protein